MPITFLLLAFASPKLWTLKAHIFREDAAFNTHNPTTNSSTAVLILWRSIALEVKESFARSFQSYCETCYKYFFTHRHLLCSLLPSVPVSTGDWPQSSKEPSLQCAVVCVGNMQVCEPSVWWMCCVSEVENGASSGTVKTTECTGQ